MNGGTSSDTLHLSSISFVCQVPLDFPTHISMNPSSFLLSFCHGSYHNLPRSQCPYDQTCYFCGYLTSPSTSNPHRFIPLLRDLEYTIYNPLLVLMLMMLKVMTWHVPGFVASPGDTRKSRAELLPPKELNILWRIKPTSSLPSIWNNIISLSHCINPCSLVSSCLCVLLLCLENHSFFNAQLIILHINFFSIP